MLAPPAIATLPVLGADPRLLSLKSAAYEALGEIFAREDADIRDKRMAAAIVLRYAAAVETRVPTPPAPPVRQSSSPLSSPAKQVSDGCQMRQHLNGTPSVPVAHEMTEPTPRTTPSLPAHILDRLASAFPVPSPAAALLSRAGAPPSPRNSQPAAVNFYPQVRPAPS
jgi:hypothetical protein